nr:hypothetical protein [Gammaproteobacteria bacterium]
MAQPASGGRAPQDTEFVRSNGDDRVGFFLFSITLSWKRQQTGARRMVETKGLTFIGLARLRFGPAEGTAAPEQSAHALPSNKTTRWSYI